MDLAGVEGASPASVNTTSAPSSSMPRASPSCRTWPERPGDAPCPEARRARGRRRQPVPGPRGARSTPRVVSSSASRAASRSTGPPEAMRSDEAVSRRSSASSSSAVSTFSPMPITAQPSWGRASISTPATLRPSIHTSFGHLIRQVTGATASHASRDGERDRQRQRLERRGRRAARARRASAPAPRAPTTCGPAPAARGLLLGSHHRPVGRSGERQLARAVVGRADDVQVDERAPERTRSRPSASAGRMATA